MPPFLRNLSVGIKHSGDNSLSPNDPSNSETIISPYKDS